MNDATWAHLALEALLGRIMRGMAGQYEEWAAELRQGLRRC
jgi:hypothetical protein